MKKIIFVIILILSTYHSNSNDNPIFNASMIGANFDYGLDINKGDFKNLPGIPNCCPYFGNGSGYGLSVGLSYDIPITSFLILGLNGNFMTFSGEFTVSESTTLIVDGISQAGTFEHFLRGDIKSIGFEPRFSFNIIDNLFVSAGVRLGYALKQEYQQKETISQPAGVGTFMDANGNDTYSRERNSNSGDIPSSNSMLIHAIGGLNYYLPLNSTSTLMLVPEIYYYYGINSVNKEANWIINSIRGGISLKYSLFSPAEDIKVEPEKDVPENIVKIEKDKQPSLFASADAKGLFDDGLVTVNPVYKIEEFLSTVSIPLLNYLFFDDNSSEIPNRYKLLDSDEMNSYKTSDLYDLPTLEKYQNILNIIGERLKKYPKGVLTITGCNSNINSEKENKSLSKARANNIKNYLVNIFKIPESRITIATRNLPEKASMPAEDNTVAEENRRVEFTSNIPEILAPVILSDTLRIASPPAVRFYPIVNADKGIDEVRIKAYQEMERTVINLDTTLTSNYPKIVDWKLASVQKSVPRFDKPLNYMISVKDKSGNLFESENYQLRIELITIEKKIRQKIDDKEFDRFSLILFDFDDEKITGQNVNIMKFIKTKIMPNSNVTINGYTDIIGDEEYNRKLSLRRANSSAKVLNLNNVVVNGFGEDVQLYDNNLPEGRFYSRTVEIQIENPIDR